MNDPLSESQRLLAESRQLRMAFEALALEAHGLTEEQADHLAMNLVQQTPFLN